MSKKSLNKHAFMHLKLTKYALRQWRIQKIFSGGATMDRVKSPLLSKNY
jgi:hypothetical protein